MSDGIQPAVLSPTKGRSRASGAPAPVVVAHRSGTLLDGVQSFCRMLEVPRADEKEGGDDTGTQLIAPLISAHVGGERVAMAWVRPSPGEPRRGAQRRLGAGEPDQPAGVAALRRLERLAGGGRRQAAATEAAGQLRGLCR